MEILARAIVKGRLKWSNDCSAVLTSCQLIIASGKIKCQIRNHVVAAKHLRSETEDRSGDAQFQMRQGQSRRPGGFRPENMPLPKGYGGPQSPSDHHSDQQIEDEIKAQLWYCGILNDQPIRIEVTNAEVTLSGNTDALEKKRVAEEAAASISGVVAVRNELDVRIRGHDEDVDTEPASTPEATESD